MASSSSSSKPLFTSLALIVLLIQLGGKPVNSQLTPDFYSRTCPQLLSIVKISMRSAMAVQPRNGASVLRLFYLDCFVNGCDASILLDDTATFTGEKNAAPNKNSVRGFEVIDKIKNQVERMCPGVVSCADILAIAARDAVNILGGPTWRVKLGRRDSMTASQAAANSSIPLPTSNLDQLITSFNAVGLSTRDLVALSGAHTVGQAQCKNFRERIYKETNIENAFAGKRKLTCPKSTVFGDGNLAPLDDQTPRAFDNNYYKNLMSKKGLLHSDQELFNGGSTDSIVRAYSNDPATFRSDFAAAMIKMGDISPLTGSKGVIRGNCRRNFG